jgi:UDP-N-acetylmuramate dehydrogenase
MKKGLYASDFSPIGLRGQLRHNEPMSQHTTWRVGGPAQWFYEPADLIDLIELMQQLPIDMPIFWVGLGSNLLVRDRGIAGVVILTTRSLNEIYLIDSNTLCVQAGVSCAKVARFAAQAQLGGCEFLAGIPGTMGGALALNAGAWGGETWALVQCVETIDRDGQQHHRSIVDYEVGYRSVKGPLNEWFVMATLKLTPKPSEEVRAQIRSLLKQRNEKQPIGLPTGGSVFQNPPGDYAARLIEQAGWKGRGIGGAVVSEKHANFIINQHNATATDIENLITQIKNSVALQFGVHLVEEVHIVGMAH